MPEEIILDVRGLEPPEPFERTTEALFRMRPGQYLKLIIPRRPRLLYPWLTEHGFQELTSELSWDLFEVYIWFTSDPDCGTVISSRLKA